MSAQSGPAPATAPVSALASALAALPSGVQAELHRRRVRSTRVRFDHGQLEELSTRQHAVQTARLIRDGRMAVVASSRPAGAQALLRAGLENLTYGTPVGFRFPGPSAVREIHLWSAEAARMEAAEMVDLAAELLQAVRGWDPRVRATSALQLAEYEHVLVNNCGFQGSYRQTVVRGILGGRLVEGDDFLWVADSRSSVAADIDFAGLKRETGQLFAWARHTVPFAPGVYPVIFAPDEVGNLLRPFGACLDGKAFARGLSPWREKLGQQLLDPRVTLLDDGTLPAKPTSLPFDREGVLTRRNVLIEAGVPRGPLLDLQTAAELGLESTGNATPAGPAPHRVILEPGDETKDQLISRLDRGLIVFGSMGAWAGNPYAGNVSGTISLGLKIEDGRIAGRVKNCMYSLNSFEHFRSHLIGLSRETKEEGGAGETGLCLPWVALDGVVISTR